MNTINPAYSFAFQPIVNTETQSIISYEALVRGVNNESAYSILSQYSGTSLHCFDEECRQAAIQLAAKLGLDCHLNLNFLPLSLKSSDKAIVSTLDTASRYNLAPDKIILEITEHEIIEDNVHFAAMMDDFKSLGLKFAIDDFGAGYSGLNLLADFQPDYIKLDMKLVRNIDKKGPRQAIVRGIIRTCLDLGIEIIAEGVESLDEYWWFREEGIELFQGYLLAKPLFQGFPEVFYPQNNLYVFERFAQAG